MKLLNGDCLKIIKMNPKFECNLLLTDIPYGEVNRKDNGLRNLNKENADIETFDLQEFLEITYEKFTSTIIIFCGIEQVSIIAKFYSQKQKKQKGTMRHLIWTKSNPSPMNGQHIYLSGIENAIWFKKRGGTFNNHCHPNYFKYPVGRNKLHPTEKNHKLLEQLILDNSNEGDKVFDPCAGSGSTLLIANKLKREVIGIEIDKKYYTIAKKRLGIE